MKIEPNYCYRCRYCTYVPNLSGYPYYECSKLKIVIDGYNTCANFISKVQIFSKPYWDILR